MEVAIKIFNFISVSEKDQLISVVLFAGTGGLKHL
jgi:hypothetical protein